LGLRREQNLLVVDPVVPKRLDGLRIETQLLGRPMEVIYRVDGSGCGPTVVNLNGADLPFTRGTNPYRRGAAEVPMAAVSAMLADGNNRLVVQVG
jgi:cellobiose phosphorylase